MKSSSTFSRLRAQLAHCLYFVSCGLCGAASAEPEDTENFEPLLRDSRLHSTASAESPVQPVTANALHQAAAPRHVRALAQRVTSPSAEQSASKVGEGATPMLGASKPNNGRQGEQTVHGSSTMPQPDAEDVHRAMPVAQNSSNTADVDALSPATAFFLRTASPVDHQTEGKSNAEAQHDQSWLTDIQGSSSAAASRDSAAVQPAGSTKQAQEEEVQTSSQHHVATKDSQQSETEHAQHESSVMGQVQSETSQEGPSSPEQLSADTVTIKQPNTITKDSKQEATREPPSPQQATTATAQEHAHEEHAPHSRPEQFPSLSETKCGHASTQSASSSSTEQVLADTKPAPSSDMEPGHAATESPSTHTEPGHVDTKPRQQEGCESSEAKQAPTATASAAESWMPAQPDDSNAHESTATTSNALGKEASAVHGEHHDPPSGAAGSEARSAGEGQHALAPAGEPEPECAAPESPDTAGSQAHGDASFQVSSDPGGTPPTPASTREPANGKTDHRQPQTLEPNPDSNDSIENLAPAARGQDHAEPENKPKAEPEIAPEAEPEAEHGSPSSASSVKQGNDSEQTSASSPLAVDSSRASTPVSEDGSRDSGKADLPINANSNGQAKGVEPIGEDINGQNGQTGKSSEENSTAGGAVSHVDVSNEAQSGTADADAVNDSEVDAPVEDAATTVNGESAKAAESGAGQKMKKHRGGKKKKKKAGK